MEVLGVDIGGSGIKGAPVNIETGELLTERHRIPTPQPATPKSVVKTVAELIKEFDWHGPVGCGFPSAIVKDVVQTAANIDNDWIGKNAAKEIMELTGCPTHVVNDVDAAGLAAMKFGQGKGHSGTVLICSFGTGIGTALFTDGVLLPNTELGHIIMPNGKEAEKYCSNLVRKTKELSWKDWTKRLNKFFKYMEDLFWPDLIIVGGGVVKYHEEFFPMLETRAEILPTLHLNHTGIIGSALSFDYAEEHIKLLGAQLQ